MPEIRTAFGIDFGTTNTRIAYCELCQTLGMVPIRDQRGESYGLPTTLAYLEGNPVAYGYEAREHHWLAPLPGFADQVAADAGHARRNRGPRVRAD